MSTLFDTVDAYRRLGFKSLMRGLKYRIGVRTGLNPVRRLQAKVSPGEFLRPTRRRCELTASSAWNETQHAFGWFSQPLEHAVPDWFVDPISGQSVKNAELPWYCIPDFAGDRIDIKGVWEASRMDWVLAMAQRCVTQGGNCDRELQRLNAWMNGWTVRNPPYVGPNWKCGQEASIRVMHLAMAMIVLYESGSSFRDEIAKTTGTMRTFISAHLNRIRPTLGYALAQNNNHGLSEAAALFIGGSWLALNADQEQTSPAAREQLAIHTLGRKWIENRVSNLFMRDGTFSQYSVTYHRFALDVLSMCETWRRKLELPSFESTTLDRAAEATRWLDAMTDPETGDAPNIGHNDGARLLQLTDTDYRDFRPTVQLAANLFLDQAAYDTPGSYDLPGQWLSLDRCSSVMHRTTGTTVFDEGGFAVTKINDFGDSRQYVKVVFRYPRFQFRPSQSDLLHVDVWLDGENVLRDGGSYSYNTDVETMNYFFGVASHNTIQFDGRDQMPRVSRFLLGRWPVAENVAFEEDVRGRTAKLQAGYSDWRKAVHHRSLEINSNTIVIVDTIQGFRDSAVLRWRLNDCNWKMNGQSFRSDDLAVQIESNTPPKRVQLLRRPESRYYRNKSDIPVIEFEVPAISSNVIEICTTLEI